MCATVSAQTHVPYLVSCVAVSLLVLATLVRRWSTFEGEERVAIRRSTSIALGATVLLWLPPIADQLRRDPGNMTMLYRHFTGEPDEPLVPLSVAVKVFLRHLDVFGASWAWLTGADGFVDRSGMPVEPGMDGSAILGAIVLLVWVAAAFTAFRMRHHLLNALNLVLGVALAAGLLSMTRIFGKVWFYLTLWAWMTMLLVVLSTVWTAALVVRRRTEVVDRHLRPALVGVAGLATILSLAAVVDHDVPEPNLSDGLREVVPPTIRALESGTGSAVGPDGTYLVFWQDSVFIGSQGYGLVNELERRGIDVGVHDTWRVPVTHHRVLPPGTYDAEVHLVSGVYIDEWRTRSDHVEIVNVDVRSDEERARFAALRERVGDRLVDLGRDDVIETVDRNLFGASLDPDLPQDVVDDLAEMLLLGEPVSIFIAPAGSTF